MNNLKRWFPLFIGGGLAALLLVAFVVAGPVFAQGPGWMMGGGGMMGGNGQGGMMGNGGMMGYTQNYTGTNAYGCPGFGGGPGYGMMGMMNGMMGNDGMMGGGMMFNNNSPFFATEPLTIAEATEAVEAYLANLNDGNLELREVMIFDNHAYVEVVEKDTGTGAMELLVDPGTKAVYPEMGPNMMWNLKYGMMSGYGGYGMMGMMGRPFNAPDPANPSTKITVTPEEAITAAQAYLDANFSQAKLTVSDEAEPFYGYYTLHVTRDGQVVGMLGVNGFTQQVFPHTWHGKLLEMSEE